MQIIEHTNDATHYFLMLTENLENILHLHLPHFTNYPWLVTTMLNSVVTEC